MPGGEWPGTADTQGQYGDVSRLPGPSEECSRCRCEGSPADRKLGCVPTGKACPGVFVPSGLGTPRGSGAVGVHSEWATVAEIAGGRGV